MVRQVTDVGVSETLKANSTERWITLVYYSLFGGMILLVLSAYILDPWNYYQTHNDFDITDFGVSILAGYFNPHWYGYGYLTFLFSGLCTFFSFVWYQVTVGANGLHDFLVQVILNPSLTLVGNRIGFFIALCLGLGTAAFYVKKKTNIFFALLFLFGMLLTESVYSIKFFIKSQALEPIWVVLSLILSEKLIESTSRKYLILSGCILGLAWSTAFTGLILAGIFLTTYLLTQLILLVRRRLNFKDLFFHQLWIVGAFLLTYALTSPYSVLDLKGWLVNTINLVREAKVGGFTWDQVPSLQKTLTYIDYNTFLSAIGVVVLFGSFILDEIRSASFKYLYGILYALINLYIYIRSPHIRDYYFFNFVLVMNVFSFVFLFRLTEQYHRLKLIIPLVILLLIVALNKDAWALNRYIHYTDPWPPNQKSELYKSKEWISQNLDTDCLIILDGWLHFLPPIVCKDSILTSNLWGHYRYGRQTNQKIQGLMGEARNFRIQSGEKVYPAMWLWFANYEFNEKYLDLIRDTLKSNKGTPIYYIVSTLWVNQYLGKNMTLQKNQVPFLDYYGRLTSGEFGAVVYRDKDVLIVKLDSRKYLNM